MDQKRVQSKLGLLLHQKSCVAAFLEKCPTLQWSLKNDVANNFHLRSYWDKRQVATSCSLMRFSHSTPYWKCFPKLDSFKMKFLLRQKSENKMKFLWKVNGITMVPKDWFGRKPSCHILFAHAFESVELFTRLGASLLL